MVYPSLHFRVTVRAPELNQYATTTLYLQHHFQPHPEVEVDLGKLHTTTTTLIVTTTTNKTSAQQNNLTTQFTTTTQYV